MCVCMFLCLYNPRVWERGRRRSIETHKRLKRKKKNDLKKIKERKREGKGKRSEESARDSSWSRDSVMMGQRTGSRCVFDATTIKRTVAFVVNVFRCVDQPCNSCTPRCSWATFVGKYIPVIDRTIVVKRTMCLNVEHMLQLIATAVEIVNINMGNVNLERYWVERLKWVWDRFGCPTSYRRSEWLIFTLLFLLADKNHVFNFY